MTDSEEDRQTCMKTEVISCSTGPDSWHTYRLDLSQFVMTDEQYITLILFLAPLVIGPALLSSMSLLLHCLFNHKGTLWIS